MKAIRTVGILVLLASTLPAQQTGAIRGILTDSSGAVIPAATISLQNTGNNDSAQITKAETNATGAYTFTNLAPGRYAVKLQFPGFESFEATVTIDAGRTADLPIQLKLLSDRQEITVATDRGPELSTDPGQSASSLSVKGSDLDALPDDPDDLTDMLAALAGPTGSAGGAPQILLDGFSGGQLPPKAAIREIKINQNPFSADYDSVGFGRIEIITKPGADKFRGSIGLTDSDAFFNSRNPYAANKADYVNRSFTGNVAGSIGMRLSYTSNFFRSTINNTALINAVTLDPVSLIEFPVRSTVVTPRTDISGTGRIDYQISTNHTLTGSYMHLLSNRDDNGIGQYSLVSRAYSTQSSRDEVRLVESAVLSPGAVTDTRFGYTRAIYDQFGTNIVPSVVVSSSFNAGSAQTGRASNENALMEFQSNTTVIHGTHTMRFGGRGRHTGITDVSPANFGGTFTFFGVARAPVLDGNNQATGQFGPISSLEQYRRTLLFDKLGYPASTIQSLGGGASQFTIAAGNPHLNYAQTDLGVYGLDDWRVKPNITLSMGLRYETQTNLGDHRDFAPRFGIAWSPKTKNGVAPKTVIRFGSGYFYGRVGTDFEQSVRRYNGATEQQLVIQNPLFYASVPTVPELLAQSTAAAQSLTTYRKDQRLRAAVKLVNAVTIERQLPAKTNLSVTYYSEAGTHLLQRVNINAPFPGTYVPGNAASGVRPYGNAAGNLFQYESGGVMKGNYLWVEVSNHLNDRVSFTSYYEIDSAHSDVDNNGAPSNPYNFGQDYGRTAWVRRNYVSFLGTFMAPGRVQFSPFFLAASGQPYDLTVGSDLNGDTLPSDRPAFATDLTRPSVVVTRFGAFDTSPLPGQKLVPRNYLTGAAMWNINMRVSKTFGFGAPRETPAAGYKGPPQHRYGLNFNLDINNILNHLNPGGYVGNLSSPLFGQSTSINLFRDTSNNRRVQFGTQFTF